MLTKPNKKNLLQYEDDYKNSFFTFFKSLTSETKFDEEKRKFVLGCFERFEDVEEYDPAREFILEVFEEIGYPKERQTEEKINTETETEAISEISVPMKIDLQQMYLLQLFQRALALNISVGTTNKRIFGIKIPFANNYAFFVKTLCLGTVMVKYKRDGEKCIPEIIQLNKIPNGWRINNDKKPLDGITIFDFYQGNFKKKKYFLEKRTMKEVRPILFGSKK